MSFVTHIKLLANKKKILLYREWGIFMPVV